MEISKTAGWKKFLERYPWFRCNGCYRLPAYSEFMPSPNPAIKVYGKPDHRILKEDDPFGWTISEMEEEYEIKPGLEHVGHQIMSNILKLAKGNNDHLIGGHDDENLKNNPYWPEELAAHASTTNHERFVTLLPLMLSRTQDDKGRIIWTFFGGTIHDPEYAFWRSFFSAPGVEISEDKSVSFFSGLISEVYKEEIKDDESLFASGFRILPSDINSLPSWTDKFRISENNIPEEIRYLLTFKPFAGLPEKIKSGYINGKINIIPYPGSLIFFGMPGYLHLQKDHPDAGQIPLLHLVARNRGIGGMRVTQSGWIHEPRQDTKDLVINERLINDQYHRTNRWQRIHRYQDELNEAAHKIKLIKALFSTEPDAMGLYDKPMACNSQIWNRHFELILDGPKADKKRLLEAEKILSEGGLFGYRFFYPPMRVGEYEVYLHRPLVAYLPEGKDTAIIKSDSLYGYLTGYHDSDMKKTNPVELWPRMSRRDLYLSALRDFNNENDHFTHQTALNILSLFENWELQKRKPLKRSFAQNLLNMAKHKTLDQWLEELDIHANTLDKSDYMRKALNEILEPRIDETVSDSLTYSETATRLFEERWWNDIKFLAHGQFLNKDNADIMMDDITLSQIKDPHRDLEPLGDYFIRRHLKSISEAGMKGRAYVGELPFKWSTLFDFRNYGGWIANQENKTYERNILVIIPGKNRKQAVVFGDHYDTAYMEDVFEKERGGNGARLSARGADDNYSASSTLLQAAPIFLKLSREGKLERDIWLLHLTGEEFPSDCMGARNFCKSLIEKSLVLNVDERIRNDLSDVEITGVYIMDMIGHNRDNDQDIFQISPGKSAESLYLASQAHIANMIWNENSHKWNRSRDRIKLGRGRRVTGTDEIPAVAKHLSLKGEVRTQYNPNSSIFNTDGQIFSDTGVPVVLFMENYDISRSGYHDTKDTLENIDLDYGAAFAAIAIETVARVATNKVAGF